MIRSINKWLHQLVPFLIVVVVAIMLGEGLRLIWIHYPDLPHWLSDLFHEYSISGAVVSSHLMSASAFVFLTAFYVYYLILSGEGRRLVGRTEGDRGILPVLCCFVFALSALALTVSGLGLYRGWSGILGVEHLYYRMHHGALSLLLLSSIVLIVLHYSRRNRLNASHDLRARVFMLSLLGAVVIAFALTWAFETTLNEPRQLVSKEINRSIFIDGIIRPIEWLGGGEATFFVSGREVDIKAIHDRQTAYLAIRWADSTRSANRKLIKTENGWTLQRTEDVDLFGERVYSEDQLAVSLTHSAKGCAATCHMQEKPLPGFHATGIDMIDIWRWQAVSTNIAGEADDGWISIKSDDTSNGVRKDNDLKSGAFLNLNREWHEPYFLPIRAIEKDAIWIGTGMAMPYLAEQDTFKIGDQIPAILVENLVGDRGDVTAYGRWHDGYWELELARKRRTGSPHDINLLDTLYLNIAIFDNAEKIHEPQLLPIRLIFE